jgi:hypothetical protein
VDFRSIYATVLQDWMGNDPNLVNFVLGQPHPTIAGLVPPIQPSVGENDRCALLGHNPHRADSGTIEIKFAMLQDGPMRLQILDQAGQLLRTILNEFRPKGSYTYLLKPADWYLSPGLYQYRLQSGGQAFKRDIKLG